jgi:hypothetical protein
MMSKTRDIKKKFNWEQFITELSELFYKENLRDKYFNLQREDLVARRVFKKEEFNELFSEEAKKLSYPEREEYYEDEKIPQAERSNFEEMPEKLSDPESHTDDDWVKIDRSLHKMILWFIEHNKDYPLTRIWWLSMGYSEPGEISYKFNYFERLYILRLLVKTSTFDKPGRPMQNGGENLCRVLSIIMDIGSFTSLEKHLKRVDNYFDFYKIYLKQSPSYDDNKTLVKGAIESDPDAKSKKKQLQKILDFFNSLHDINKDYCDVKKEIEKELKNCGEYFPETKKGKK